MTKRDFFDIDDMNDLCLGQAETIIRLIKRCEDLIRQRDFYKGEYEKLRRRIQGEDTFNFGEGNRYKVTKVGETSE